MKYLPSRTTLISPLSAVSSETASNRSWRFSWLLSLSLHLGTVAVLVLPLLMAPARNEPALANIEIDGSWGTASVEATGTQLLSADSDDRWRNVMLSSQEQTVLPNPSDSAISSFVRKRIDKSIEDGKNRDSQANEDELSRLGQRLETTSSQANIDRMAQFLSGLTGKRKELASEEDMQRPFDVSTAQIDRVRKEEDSEGRVHYIATLVDENGNSTDLELDSEIGPQLYRTMKIIESNPLLERVYRKIVMGFLDQMLSKPTTK